MLVGFSERLAAIHCANDWCSVKKGFNYLSLLLCDVACSRRHFGSVHFSPVNARAKARGAVCSLFSPLNLAGGPQCFKQDESLARFVSVGNSRASHVSADRVARSVFLFRMFDDSPYLERVAGPATVAAVVCAVVVFFQTFKHSDQNHHCSRVLFYHCCFGDVQFAVVLVWLPQQGLWYGWVSLMILTKLEVFFAQTTRNKCAGIYIITTLTQPRAPEINMIFTCTHLSNLHFPCCDRTTATMSCGQLTNHLYFQCANMVRRHARPVIESSSASKVTCAGGTFVQVGAHGSGRVLLSVVSSC